MPDMTGFYEALGTDEKVRIAVETYSCANDFGKSAYPVAPDG
jgi:hypothetical protein